MKSSIRSITLILVAGLVFGLSGCVTTAQLDEAMSIARQAQADAQSASTAASAAKSSADDAKRAAMSASQAAKAASDAAGQANSCCAANSDKIDRMFRESMKK